MTNQIEVRIEWLGGAVPVQAEGYIALKGERYPFYFRYRGDRAAMYIWAPGSPQDFLDHTELAYYEQRDVTGVEANGYMDDPEALAFIKQWSEEFVKGDVVLIGPEREIGGGHRPSQRKNDDGV